MATLVQGTRVGPPPTYDQYLKLSAAVDALPVEMLSHVMQYLSVSDRKDAALVSKKWYEASLHPMVQRNMVVSVKSSVTKPRPFSRLQNRPGFHLALSDIDGSPNSDQLMAMCEANLGPKLLTLSLKGSNLSQNALVTILSRCSNLTSLDVSCCNNLLLSGSGIWTRLGGITLPLLRHLDLSSMRQLSDASLCGFLSIAPNLQSLELASTPFLFSSSYLYSDVNSRPNSAALTFNRFLLEVSRLSSTLVSLNLSRTAISNGGLESLAKVPNFNLKSICLVSCKDMTDSGIIALALNQRGIEDLDLASNSQLTATCVKYIAANLIKLRYLNITKIVLQPKESKLLRNISTCSKIVLSASLLQTMPVEEMDLAFEAWRPALHSLDLSYCAGLTNKSLISMCQRMESLTELNLSSCFRLDDVTLREISKCLVNLTALSVSWCKHVTDMGLFGVYHEDYTHNCVKECRCGRQKEVAYFEYTPPVRDIAPRELVPSRHHIVSAINEQGGEGHFPITRLTKLRSLDLSVCSKVTDFSIAHVLSFPALSTLNLAMCSRITDSAVIAIAKNNPLLESVNLAQCREITDQSVHTLLSHCRRLVHLNISNCSLLTDNTIHSIIKLRAKLKSLDVSLCNISMETIDKLERLVPTLRTVHKQYTSANGF